MPEISHDRSVAGVYTPLVDGPTALISQVRTLAADLRARPDRSATRMAALADRLDLLATAMMNDASLWRDAAHSHLTTHDAWLLAAEAGTLREIVANWRDIPGPDAAAVCALLGARVEQAERGRTLVIALLSYGSESAPRAALPPLGPRPAALDARPQDWAASEHGEHGG